MKKERSPRIAHVLVAFLAILLTAAICPASASPWGSLAFGEDASLQAVAPQATQDVMVQYGNNPVTAARGTFTFGDTGVTMTVKVDGVDYTGNGNSFPAEAGKIVELTFAGIPTGNVVTIATSGGDITVTKDGPCTFTMGNTIGRLDIAVNEPSFQVTQGNSPVTSVSGTFTFDKGVAMTATVDGTAYSGSTDYVTAAYGKTVELTFDNIPTGASVTVDKSGGSTTIQSTGNKAISFKMDDTTTTVDVTVNADVTLSLNAGTSRYDSDFKTTFATLVYRVDGGAWTDLADGIANHVVAERQSGTQYTYVMPEGTIDIKAIQPYDTATGKYKTNNGIGFMMEYTTPTGGIKQPYPEEFNGAAGLEIDGYTTPGVYSLNFMPPFWSLIWSSTPNSVITADEVLKNGTFKIVDFSTNPAIDQAMSHQAADGTQGYALITDPTANITATLTPARGYQVLSSSIKDDQGNQISIAPDGNNVCTFTFNIANNKNMHVGSVFAAVSDSATTTSTSVVGASVSDTQGAIDSGNLDLTVSDAATKLDEAQATAAVQPTTTSTQSDVSVVATYEVNLEQYWNQASTTAAWTNNLTQTSVPVSFSLKLNDSLRLADDETYQVVRTHDGVNEVVDSTYDAATNTVTVSSDKFSEFSLVKTNAAATTAVTPKTSDDAPTGAITLGILVGAAALVVSARLRRNA